jgi:hypothetical protein
LYSILAPLLMNKPYTVALQEAPGLPVRDRIEAEVRFARELERALGGEDAVAETYRSWINASEADANELDAQTAEKAVRWPRAADAATRAGLSKLGFAEAYFEVRLARGHADARG